MAGQNGSPRRMNWIKWLVTFGLCWIFAAVLAQFLPWSGRPRLVQDLTIIAWSCLVATWGQEQKRHSWWLFALFVVILVCALALEGTG